jgi:hypothetical protein
MPARLLVTTWGCWEDGCEAGDTGHDWGALDRAAERHTKREGHATWCRTHPQPPSSCPCGDHEHDSYL